MGVQGSGKSSHYARCYADSHVRINLDMLRTRHRESALLHACLSVGQSFVVDNTNPTAQARVAKFEPVDPDEGFDRVTRITTEPKPQASENQTHD